MGAWPFAVYTQLLSHVRAGVTPQTGPHDVEVMLVQDNDGERWVRRFGSSRFSSLLTDAGPLGLFEERFGPLRFKFDLQSTPNGVSWEFCGWSFAELALPNRLAPRIRAGAEDANGLYRFKVVVSHRLTGLLFAYRGILSLSTNATSKHRQRGPVGEPESHVIAAP